MAEEENKKKLIIAYCPCPSKEEAKTIAKTIINENLAACVNIIPGGISVYKWDGEVCMDEEIYVLFKTREEMFEKLKDRIVECHSADLPCVLGLPVGKVNNGFLDWVYEQTEEKKEEKS